MMPKRVVNTVQSNFLAFLPTSTYTKDDILRAFLPTKESEEMKVMLSYRKSLEFVLKGEKLKKLDALTVVKG